MLVNIYYFYEIIWVGRMSFCPKCPHPNLWNLWICYISQQKRFCRCDSIFRFWDGEIILDDLGGSNLIIWALKSREPSPGENFPQQENLERFKFWERLDPLWLEKGGACGEHKKEGRWFLRARTISQPTASKARGPLSLTTDRNRTQPTTGVSMDMGSFSEPPERKTALLAS